MSACSRRSFLLGMALAAGAGRSSRAAILRPGPLLWSRKVAMGEGDWPSREVVPAADSKQLYIPLIDRVLAIDLQTGEPAWPTLREKDDGAIYRGPASSQGLPSRAVTSAIVRDGRLLTLTGAISDAPASVRDFTHFPTLSAFDVGGSEGKLLWTQGLEGTLAASGWRAAALPALVGDSVWLPVVNQQRSMRPGLAELDPSNGSLRATVLMPVSPDGTANWAGNAPVSVGGRLFCRRIDGTVVAVSLADRRVEWRTEPRAARQTLKHAGIVPGAGMVHVATPDGRIEAIDTDDGQVRWTFDLEEENPQVCGLSGDQLICAGRRIWALDAATGAPRGRWGFVDTPPLGSVAIEGRAVAWSTERELVALDSSNGAVVGRDELAQSWNLTGGDTWSMGGRLVLVGGNRISVFRADRE
ncbi:outer membrane biogenesis protein BamB [Caulifigura coniformis]|uniref:Outer membrane biogenesis protein BamB n=1 Tax=Caulifigura coniformis TaxID=2527983 RepID=A0A517SFZ9_9PLAN|nr:PQQ-binding-like beta-propeller repeat protein [Caulifigura coniformis]QDT55053.1 outer membrane biogenesis protein BamB [Caulifigura coniformis]